MILEFSFKYKDYEIKACPKHLARLSKDEPNETINLLKWDKDSGKPYCYSLAYFTRDKEGYDLKFVGDRPFRCIEKEDVPIIWEALKQAQAILDAFWEWQENER